MVATGTINDEPPNRRVGADLPPRPNVDLVPFDLNDRATYVSAPSGADVFALVTPGLEPLTGCDIARILSEVRGTPVTYISPPFSALRASLREQGAPLAGLLPGPQNRRYKVDRRWRALSGSVPA